MPRVSIITAAYNHVRFVRQAIESAQSQTYRDFEHIVVDDGSSDGTAKVLKGFEDRIIYTRQENRGTYATLNQAIAASSGEFIAFLDSDDAWLPNKLERQIEAFERFPEAGLVYSQAFLIDAEGKLKNNELIGKPLKDPNHSFAELLNENHIPALTAVFRRACIEDLGALNESFKAMADWDLWLRIAARWPVIFVPEALAQYRVHESNAGNRLLESGQVFKERLLLLKNASRVIAGNSREEAQTRELIRATFSHTALRTTYSDFYRHRYFRALTYFLFALRLHPLLLKDALVAVRPRFIAKLLVGERGIKALSSPRRLENWRL